MIKGKITLCVRSLRLRSHTEPWGETTSAILNYFRVSEKLRLPSYWCFVQRKQKEKETSVVRAATDLMRQELASGTPRCPASQAQGRETGGVEVSSSRGDDWRIESWCWHS